MRYDLNPFLDSIARHSMHLGKVCRRYLFLELFAKNLLIYQLIYLLSDLFKLMFNIFPVVSFHFVVVVKRCRQCTFKFDNLIPKKFSYISHFLIIGCVI